MATILIEQSLAKSKSYFEKLGAIAIVDFCNIDNDTAGTASTANNAEVIIIRSITTVDKKFLQKFPNLKVVATATSGTDHIDINFLKKSGIKLVTATGANSRAVAEYSIAAIVSMLGSKLTGMALGIIGYGNVGKTIINIATKFGCKICCYDPYCNDSSLASFDEVLNCSIISLNCAYSKTGQFPSHHLIDSNALQAMKNCKLLINTARGDVINHQNLIAFANSNKQIKFVFDVWHSEPNIAASLLQIASIATPHIAGHTQLAKDTALYLLAEQLSDFYSVNAPKRLPLATINNLEPATNLNDFLEKIYNFKSYTRQMQQKNFSAKQFLKLRSAYPLRYELEQLSDTESLKYF